MHQVNCPQCGKAFQIEGESIGSEFQCDRCEAIFFVDLPEADDDAHAQPEPPVATGAAVAYAQRKEIDINEQAERFFGTSVEAAQACDHWRQLMPKVSSLYRPSGAVPIVGIASLLVGAVVAIAFGMLVLTIFGFATGVLSLGVGAVIQFIAGLMNFSPEFLFAVVVVLGALIMLAGHFFAGLYVVRRFLIFVWKGKIRNRIIPILMSLLVAAGTSLLFRYAVIHFELTRIVYFEMLVEAYDKYYSLQTLGYIGAAIEVLFMCWIVYYSAKQVLAMFRFCEPCDSGMMAGSVRKLRLGAAAALARAMEEGDLDVAHDVLRVGAGDDAFFDIFVCPVCGQGYIEVRTDIISGYNDKGGKRKHVSYRCLVASQEYGDREMRDFRNILCQIEPALAETWQ